MVESARRHERIQPSQSPGVLYKIDSVFSRPVDLFIPDSDSAGGRTLLVHLFGAPFVPTHAAASAHARYVVAVVNLGGNSSAYERAFSDSVQWNRLLRKAREATAALTGNRITIDRIAVSAFSAGYAGVRALLSDSAAAASIGAVILLDGLHTGYIPERRVLADGGALDTLKLVPFLRYARRAVMGETEMLMTHSEIFPGTFASTTETTDWLVRALGLSRNPVLAWGPGGMQQISEVRAGGLTILGYAGNTAPDHVDHFHGMGGFLAVLTRSARR